jgi:hypothetical protein
MKPGLSLKFKLKPSIIIIAKFLVRFLQICSNFLSDFYEFVHVICAVKAEIESVGYISHDILIAQKTWIRTPMR